MLLEYLPPPYTTRYTSLIVNVRGMVRRFVIHTIHDVVVLWPAIHRRGVPAEAPVCPYVGGHAGADSDCDRNSEENEEDGSLSYDSVSSTNANTGGRVNPEDHSTVPFWEYTLPKPQEAATEFL